MIKNTIRKGWAVPLIPRIWRGHTVKCAPLKIKRSSVYLQAAGITTDSKDNNGQFDKCKRSGDVPGDEFHPEDIKDKGNIYDKQDTKDKEGIKDDSEDKVSRENILATTEFEDVKYLDPQSNPYRLLEDSVNRATTTKSNNEELQQKVETLHEPSVVEAACVVKDSWPFISPKTLTGKPQYWLPKEKRQVNFALLDDVTTMRLIRNIMYRSPESRRRRRLAMKSKLGPRNIGTSETEGKKTDLLLKDNENYDVAQSVVKRSKGPVLDLDQMNTQSVLKTATKDLDKPKLTEEASGFKVKKEEVTKKAEEVKPEVNQEDSFYGFNFGVDDDPQWPGQGTRYKRSLPGSVMWVKSKSNKLSTSKLKDMKSEKSKEEKETGPLSNENLAPDEDPFVNPVRVDQLGNDPNPSSTTPLSRSDTPTLNMVKNNAINSKRLDTFRLNLAENNAGISNVSDTPRLNIIENKTISKNIVKDLKATTAQDRDTKSQAVLDETNHNQQYPNVKSTTPLSRSGTPILFKVKNNSINSNRLDTPRLNVPKNDAVMSNISDIIENETISKNDVKDLKATTVEDRDTNSQEELDEMNHNLRASDLTSHIYNEPLLKPTQTVTDNDSSNFKDEHVIRATEMSHTLQIDKAIRDKSQEVTRESWTRKLFRVKEQLPSPSTTQTVASSTHSNPSKNESKLLESTVANNLPIWSNKNAAKWTSQLSFSEDPQWYYSSKQGEKAYKENKLFFFRLRPDTAQKSRKEPIDKTETYGLVSKTQVVSSKHLNILSGDTSKQISKERQSENAPKGEPILENDILKSYVTEQKQVCNIGESNLKEKLKSHMDQGKQHSANLNLEDVQLIEQVTAEKQPNFVGDPISEKHPILHVTKENVHICVNKHISENLADESNRLAESVLGEEHPVSKITAEKSILTDETKSRHLTESIIKEKQLLGQLGAENSILQDVTEEKKPIESILGKGQPVLQLTKEKPIPQDVVKEKQSSHLSETILDEKQPATQTTVENNHIDLAKPILGDIEKNQNPSNLSDSIFGEERSKQERRRKPVLQNTELNQRLAKHISQEVTEGEKPSHLTESILEPICLTEPNINMSDEEQYKYIAEHVLLNDQINLKNKETRPIYKAEPISEEKQLKSKIDKEGQHTSYYNLKQDWLKPELPDNETQKNPTFYKARPKLKEKSQKCHLTEEVYNYYYNLKQDRFEPHATKDTNNLSTAKTKPVGNVNESRSLTETANTVSDDRKILEASKEYKNRKDKPNYDEIYAILRSKAEITADNQKATRGLEALKEKLRAAYAFKPSSLITRNPDTDTEDTSKKQKSIKPAYHYDSSKNIPALQEEKEHLRKLEDIHRTSKALSRVLVDQIINMSKDSNTQKTTKTSQNILQTKTMPKQIDIHTSKFASSEQEIHIVKPANSRQIPDLNTSDVQNVDTLNPRRHYDLNVSSNLKLQVTTKPAKDYNKMMTFPIPKEKLDKEAEKVEDKKLRIIGRVPVIIGPMPVITKDMPLSMLLKTVRLRNRLASYKMFLESLQATSSVDVDMKDCPDPCKPPDDSGCPDPCKKSDEKKKTKPKCPPPPCPKPKCPPPPCPKPKCPPPPCPKPKPRCPKPKQSPKPKIKPKCPGPKKKKDPCAKCVSAETDWPFHLNEIAPKHSVFDVTPNVVITLQGNGTSKDAKESTDSFESVPVTEVVSARGFEAWVPIPSWPHRSETPKRTLLRPKDGCPLTPSPPPEKDTCKPREKPCKGSFKRRTVPIDFDVK